MFGRGFTLGALAAVLAAPWVAAPASAQLAGAMLPPVGILTGANAIELTDLPDPQMSSVSETGQTVIDKFGYCRMLVGPEGSPPLMLPLATRGEWEAALSNIPAGYSVRRCCQPLVDRQVCSTYGIPYGAEGQLAVLQGERWDVEYACQATDPAAANPVWVPLTDRQNVCYAFEWRYQGWSACQATTYGLGRLQPAACVRSDGKVETDPTLCATPQPPPNFAGCAASWSVGAFGQCTAGQATTSRSVGCVAEDGSPVAEGFCPSPKPATTQACVVDIAIGSATDLNLWNALAAAGWRNPAPYRVTIVPGAVIQASSPATPAFDTGAFPAGSTLTIVNQGTISGAGGRGGAGAGVSIWCQTGAEFSCTSYGVFSSAGTGAPGGAAFVARMPVNLDNSVGIVQGGGGGGGGSGAMWSITPQGDNSGRGSPDATVILEGGGGGGGAGSGAGAGGAGGREEPQIFFGQAVKTGPAGAAGSTAAGGGGGRTDWWGAVFINTLWVQAGGQGGAPGQPGGAGTAGPTDYRTDGYGSGGSNGGAPGGAAGAAVVNGGYVTWLGGYDAVRVRGPVQ